VSVSPAAVHVYAELPAVLDVPGVAEVLGCGERAVRDLLQRGQLGHVRLGRLIRIPRHVLVAFLEGARPLPASGERAEP
jgi:excisionase family DNA binding protein